jgi:hypothetical protein
MATFNKLNGFVEHLAEGTHNLGSHQLAIALSNTAGDITTANASTAACVIGSVTQISYTNLSGATPRNLTVSASAQSGGTYKLTIADLVLTATGTVGPFQYVFIYNDGATTPADALIGYYDYSSAVTLQNGETFTINFDDANGVLTIA